LYGAVKGDDVNGVVIVDAAAAVGEVKDGGRAGTEGGVVVGDGPVPVFVEAGVALGAVVGIGEVVLAAGTDVDAAAAAAMVPLRSHGFGGEPIVSNRTEVEGAGAGAGAQETKSVCGCE
jgi:hypothetical protein